MQERLIQIRLSGEREKERKREIESRDKVGRELDSEGVGGR